MSVAKEGCPQLEPATAVIIGCGLTGLAISRSLSKAGVRHLLLGKPAAKGTPRLGESINAEGTVDLEEFFPELKDTYFRKRVY